MAMLPRPTTVTMRTGHLSTDVPAATRTGTARQTNQETTRGTGTGPLADIKDGSTGLAPVPLKGLLSTHPTPAEKTKTEEYKMLQRRPGL